MSYLAKMQKDFTPAVLPVTALLIYPGVGQALEVIMLLDPVK